MGTDYIWSRDYSPNLTDTFWIWTWAAFAVGIEHPSERTVQAWRDQSCSELVAFTGNEHQRCGEMSQTIAGQANGSQGVWGSEGTLSDCLWAADAKAARSYRCCQREG